MNGWPGDSRSTHPPSFLSQPDPHRPGLGQRNRPRLDAGEAWVYFAGGLEHDRSGVTALVHAADAAIHGELRPDLVAPFDFASRHGGLRLVVPSDPRTAETQLSW